MSHHKGSFEPIVQGLKNALEDLLPEGIGSLEVGSSDTPTEITLRIKPTRANGAPIEVTLDKDFGAYLTVGKGSVFEIRFEDKRYSERGFTDNVVALVSAIIRNGFEEDVLLADGVVTGASGVIKRGGQLANDVRESWRKIRWGLFSKREREHHIYVPY